MAARWMTASTPSRAGLTAAGSQTSPLTSSKKRFEQQGKQAVAAELEACRGRGRGVPAPAASGPVSSRRNRLRR